MAAQVRDLRNKMIPGNGNPAEHQLTSKTKMFERRQEARRLLLEMYHILEREGEMNCSQGVLAAIASLEDPDAESGYDRARSIYRTMAKGKAPLSDYYVQRPDPVDQAIANRRLDEIRDDLWRVFA